jgi:hypothetical protein
VERVGQARVLRSKHSFKGAGEESVDGAITIPLPKPGAEFGAFSFASFFITPRCTHFFEKSWPA